MTSSWPPEEGGSVTRETVLDGVPRASSGFQTHPKGAEGCLILDVEIRREAEQEYLDLKRRQA
jgi:hypothetical protein